MCIVHDKYDPQVNKEKGRDQKCDFASHTRIATTRVARELTLILFGPLSRPGRNLLNPNDRRACIFPLDTHLHMHLLRAHTRKIQCTLCAQKDEFSPWHGKSSRNPGDSPR